MFTGIVTDVGEVLAIDERQTGIRLKIASRYAEAGIDIGASIAHAGICLTVVDKGEEGNRDWFAVEASPETLAVTTMGSWAPGSRVNLERSLTLGQEMGGHLVTGHIDGVAEVIGRDNDGDMAVLTFRVPDAFARFIAAKGSVALDGTSLTVNLVEGSTFTVMLIPHTLDVTTWGAIKLGDKVNFEVDLMARYAARLMEAQPATSQP
ncbi:MAG: riboflavin synthase [Ancalomicrobiaceae bacterium]|nr:riboflavin synthase [Ancalomicrobiaceae bacterium]